VNILEPFKKELYFTELSGNSSSLVNDFYGMYFCIGA
jgi:hypothetical protein